MRSPFVHQLESNHSSESAKARTRLSGVYTPVNTLPRSLQIDCSCRHNAPPPKPELSTISEHNNESNPGISTVEAPALAPDDTPFNSNLQLDSTDIQRSPSAPTVLGVDIASPTIEHAVLAESVGGASSSIAEANDTTQEAHNDNLRSETMKFEVPPEILDAWNKAIPYYTYALSSNLASYLKRSTKSLSQWESGLSLTPIEYIGSSLEHARPVIKVLARDTESVSLVKQAFRDWRRLIPESLKFSLQKLRIDYPTKEEMKKWKEELKMQQKKQRKCTKSQKGKGKPNATILEKTVSKFSIIMNCDKEKHQNALTSESTKPNSEVQTEVELHYGTRIHAFRGDFYIGSVTIGGFILLRGRPFAVTAGHLFTKCCINGDEMEPTHDNHDTIMGLDEEEIDESGSKSTDYSETDDSGSIFGDDDEAKDESWPSPRNWESWDVFGTDRDDDLHQGERTTPDIAPISIIQKNSPLQYLPTDEATTNEGSTVHPSKLRPDCEKEQKSPPSAQPITFRLGKSKLSPLVGVAYYYPYMSHIYQEHGREKVAIGATRIYEDDWLMVLPANGVRIIPHYTLSLNNTSRMEEGIKNHVVSKANLPRKEVSLITPEAWHQPFGKGTISNSPSITLLPGLQKFQIVWCLSIPQPLGEGSSGIWTTCQDNESELLAGQIIAEMPDAHLAFFIPLETLFTRVRHYFPNSKLTLLTAPSINAERQRVEAHSDRVETSETSISCSEPFSEIGQQELLIPRWLTTQSQGEILADFSSITPLHIAALIGDADGASALISAGVYFDARTDKMETPLHLSAQTGNFKVAQTLIEAGADVNAITSDGSRPLHLAAYTGRPGGLEPSDRTTEGVGQEESGRRVGYGYCITIKLLLEAGADVDALDENNQTAIHILARYEHSGAIGILLDVGANVNIVDARKQLPLHILAGCKYSDGMEGEHTEALRRVLEAGANVNATDDSGQTHLQLTASRGEVKVKETLLQFGTDPNAKDKPQQTLSHLGKPKGLDDGVNILQTCEVSSVLVEPAIASGTSTGTIGENDVDNDQQTSTKFENNTNSNVGQANLDFVVEKKRATTASPGRALGQKSTAKYHPEDSGADRAKLTKPNQGYYSHLYPIDLGLELPPDNVEGIVQAPTGAIFSWKENNFESYSPPLKNLDVRETFAVCSDATSQGPPFIETMRQRNWADGKAKCGCRRAH